MIHTAIERIRALLDLGGVVIGVLMVMSVIALAIVLWKTLVFEISGVGRGLKRGFLKQALSQVHLNSTDSNDARTRIYARLDTEFGRVSAGLRFLDLTAQISPLLGLFGTVLGMITAFQALQDAGNSADPSILAGGIWVALLTTAAGLVVAIPASLLLNWFDSRLEAHRRTANEAVETLFSPEVFKP